ncbi:MAG: hypothetical protein AAF899_07830 [Pseudomonadota bacterium]
MADTPASETLATLLAKTDRRDDWDHHAFAAFGSETDNGNPGIGILRLAKDDEKTDDLSR